MEWVEGKEKDGEGNEGKPTQTSNSKTAYGDRPPNLVFIKKDNNELYYSDIIMTFLCQSCVD